MAHNSRPTAEAVIPKYIIWISMGVVDGNCIFSDEKPKPASIAAIPITQMLILVLNEQLLCFDDEIIFVDFRLPEIELYKPTK